MIYLGQKTWIASSPTTYAQFWYEKYRSGTSMFYRFKVRMWIGTYSYYNNRIRGIHNLDGSQVYNTLIKNTTSGSWDVTVTTPWCKLEDKLTGSTAYAIRIVDDNNGSHDTTYNFTLGVDNATPILNISYNSKTYNSITINYTNSGPTDATTIRINNGTTVLGSYPAGSPITISGLSPKTTYSDLKAYGYSAAGWGSVSNSISVTTHPSPVSVTSPTVSNITPFTCTLMMSSSSAIDTYSSEYSIYDSTGVNLIQGPYVNTPEVWSKDISGLDAETTYLAAFRVRTNDSLTWSPYSTVSFTTTSDQAQIYMKISGTWIKGRLYAKVSGSWVVVKKAYRKVSGSWVEAINT